MTTKTVTLYSVRIDYGGGLEMVSVEAEERPATYYLRQREGGGFRYNQVIRKAALTMRGIAVSKQLAIELFILEQNRKILASYDAIARWEKQIRVADALFVRTEKG